MKSKNKDWFRYNRYWRTWERVLVRGGGDYTHQVAVPLVPVNDIDSEWNEIREVSITRTDVRYAYAAKAGKDIQWTHELPDDVYDRMVEKLGKEKADFLVHADIYKLVDWNEYAKYGGTVTTSLYLCRRDLSINFRVVHKDEHGTREIYMKPAQFCVHAGFMLSVNCDLVGGVCITEGERKSSSVVIYYDHINAITAVEISTSIPDKEETHTRILGKHGDRWNDRLIDYTAEMVSLGHLVEADRRVINEVVDNAWTLIQAGTI